MRTPSDIRVRSTAAEAAVEERKGKVLTEDDIDVLITNDTLVRKPDGSRLLIYRRGIIPEELREASYPILHALKDYTTTNRGLASGMKRAKRFSGSRTYTKPIASSIIGYFDPAGPKQYCRTTAWTGTETEAFEGLYPFFGFASERMQEDTPERYAAQMEFIGRTNRDWVIPGTPFTTVTVNNSYPTGVHTDKGDLDEGISALAVLRRGDYEGGYLCFPQYRVGVNMRDGDFILMDAHEWHGNVALTCSECRANVREFHTHPGDEAAGIKPHTTERISVVMYYRTNMVACESREAEAEKQMASAERANERVLAGT